jgi:putative flippase GtrA
MLFVLYLLLTSFGLAPMLAMSGLFALGTIQTFMINKRWTFMHQVSTQAYFLKYATIYCLSYLINLTALFILVNKLNYPRQIVQGLMILILSLMLSM